MQNNYGKIELFIGLKFSGKTTGLIEKIRKYYFKINFHKHKNTFSENKIIKNNQIKYDLLTCKCLSEKC